MVRVGKEPDRRCKDMACASRRLARFAVADGASQSYDSVGWARAICRRYIRGEAPSPQWVSAARAAYQSTLKVDALDWAATAAAERGSYTTFLGFAFEGDRLIVHAIGDTTLFVLFADGVQLVYPAMRAEDYAARPALLCSRPGRSAFDDSAEAFDGRTLCVPAPPGGWDGTSLVALTDALGAWVQAVDDDVGRRARLDTLLGLRAPEPFSDWIHEAIAAGRVAYDDCLVLAVRL